MPYLPVGELPYLTLFQLHMLSVGACSYTLLSFSLQEVAQKTMHTVEMPSELLHTSYALLIVKGKGVKKPGLSVGCCSNLLLTFRNNDLLLCCFLQIILITSQQ